MTKLRCDEFQLTVTTAAVTSELQYSRRHEEDVSAFTYCILFQIG